MTGSAGAAVASAWSESFLELYWRGRLVGFAAASVLVAIVAQTTNAFTLRQGIWVAAVTLVTTLGLYAGSRAARFASGVPFRLAHLVIDLGTVHLAVQLTDAGALRLAYPMVVVAHAAISGPIGGAVAAVGATILVSLVAPGNGQDRWLATAMVGWTSPFIVWVVASLRGSYTRNLGRLAMMRHGVEQAHGSDESNALAALARSIASATLASAVLISGEPRPGTNGTTAVWPIEESEPRLDVLVDVLDQRRVSEALVAGLDVIIRRDETTQVERALLDEFTLRPVNAVRISPLAYSGTGYGVMAVAYRHADEADDLDERAMLAVYASQAQALLARVYGEHLTAEVDRIKLAFLSAAGHGIITPLTSSMGLVELLSAGWRELPEAKVDSFLETALNSLKRLQLLTEQLSDLERLLRDDSLSQPVATDLAPLLDARVAGMAVALGERRLVLDVAPTLQVMADPLILDRVLGHLLLNAAQATGPDGHVWVRAIRLGDAVAVEVGDNGHGMDPAELSQARELFHRGSLHEATGNGMGVGLAFVDRFIRRDGGSLSITSQVDVGTRVTITLPLAGGDRVFSLDE